ACVNHAQPEHLQRDSESQIAGSKLFVEIWLPQSTVRNCRVVNDSPYGPELMYTAVTGAGGVKLESHLTNRAVLFLKNRNEILFSKAMRDQAKLRILCRL